MCLATLHTNNAYQSVERIVNMFPEEYHSQIRLNLSTNLKAIISQRLVASKQGSGTMAIEILLNQGLVRELIQTGEISKIRDVMAQNNPLGMCIFDQSLFRLLKDGMITEEVALSQADQPGDLRIKIQQLKLGGVGKGESLNKLDTSLLSISD